MRILMTGATGLVGKELGKELTQLGHELVVISRSRQKAKEELPFAAEIIEHDLNKGPLSQKLNQIDGVFHLAGENVGDRRWNEKVKTAIRVSRVEATKNLIASFQVEPAVFVSSSAIGFYGDRGDEVLSENSAKGEGFLSDVCADWEKASASLSCRRVLLRTGVVLSPVGGALQKMLFPFRAGVGGALGSGKSWMSWIDVRDLVSLMIFVLDNKQASGVINGVSPEPLTNLEFSKILAKSLKRPLGPNVPGFALKALLGEMSTIVLSSQRVLPEQAQKLGFKFRHSNLSDVFQEFFEPYNKGEEVFYAEQFVPLKPSELFPFFSEAQNLEAITPDILSFKVEKVSTPQIQQGTLIDYTLKIHGVPAKWKTIIDEWQPPYKFVDNQLKGPYKLWHHTHGFKEVPGGTLMTDRVRYRLPMGILGWLTAWHFVRKDVSTIFSFRRKVVADKFYRK
ncbi:MAG: TIGR01777 family oxidoreductase [Bdellovibrionia bacterium]